MERVTKIANEGYIFTQVAEVPIEQRVWGSVIDTTHIEQFHEVPIAEYDAWQKEMEELNNLNTLNTDSYE